MKRSLPPPEARPEDGRDEKPFMAHLEELRRTLIYIILALAAGLAAALPLTIRGYTLGLLRRPLILAVGRAGGPVQSETILATLYPGGGFAVVMKVALQTSLVISLPFILYFAGMFILPALTKNERRYFAPALLSGALLFYGGMIFCYFTVLPWAVRFFWSFNNFLGIRNLWTINDYVSFTVRMLMAFGLAFEFPLVILALVCMGLLNYRMLSGGRRYAIVLIFIMAAVLTPPDALSQALMAVPLLVLYEISVWGARLIEKRNR